MGADLSTQQAGTTGPAKGNVVGIATSTLYFGTSVSRVCDWEYPDVDPLERGPPFLVGELLANIEHPKVPAARRSGNWIEDFQCGVEHLASECYESGDRQEWATNLSHFVLDWSLQPAEGFALLRHYCDALPVAMLPEPHATTIFETVESLNEAPSDSEVDQHAKLELIATVFFKSLPESGYAAECNTLRFIIASSAFQHLSIATLGRTTASFQKPAASSPKLDLTGAFELLRKNLAIIGMAPRGRGGGGEHDTATSTAADTTTAVTTPALTPRIESTPPPAAGAQPLTTTTGNMMMPGGDDDDSTTEEDEEKPIPDYTPQQQLEKIGADRPHGRANVVANTNRELESFPADVPVARSATDAVPLVEKSQQNSILVAVQDGVTVPVPTANVSVDLSTNGIVPEGLSAEPTPEQSLEAAKAELATKQMKVKATAEETKRKMDAARVTEEHKSKMAVQEAENRLKNSKLAFQTTALGVSTGAAMDAAESIPVQGSDVLPPAMVSSEESRALSSVVDSHGHFQVLDALAQLTSTVMQLQETVAKVVTDQEMIKVQVREVRSELLHSVPPLQSATAAVAKEHQLVAEELLETQKILQIESDRVGNMRKDIEAATMASVYARQGTEDAQLRWISLERAQLEQKQIVSSLRDHVTISNREMSRLRQENDSTKVELALLKKRFNSRGPQYM